MAGSTRELAIIALAEGRALHPQHPGRSHPRSPPVLSNFFSTGVTLDFFFKRPVCQLLSFCCISKCTGLCPISRC